MEGCLLHVIGAQRDSPGSLNEAFPGWFNFKICICL